jgi:Mrp family chromosome partitioning ATPase
MRNDDEPRPPGTAERLDVHPRARARLDRSLVAHAAPDGLECEAFRGLYYRLRRAMGGQPLGVLGVVSSTRGEGRTTVAANLALVAARETLSDVGLVDADLRAPALHRLFGLDGEVGLSDVLANRAVVV